MKYYEINLLKEGKIKFESTPTIDVHDIEPGMIFFVYKKANLGSNRKQKKTQFVKTLHLSDDEKEHFDLFATHYLVYRRPDYDVSDDDFQKILNRNFNSLKIVSTKPK